MSLAEDLEQNIRDAWLRLRKQILSDPHDLHRRLARRRLKSLTRPPRPWCIAIRASDRRITPAHWIIVPEHAMDLTDPRHPYQPIEHQVIIGAHAIRRYCTPVSFANDDAEYVAKMLGVSHAILLRARHRGRFSQNLVKGLGGKRGGFPVPLLSNGGQLVDPSDRDFAAPHPIWGSMWEWLSREFPKDFEQTVLRRPHFKRIGERYRHPDDPPKFMGWHWLCPICKKEVRTIYYPIPVRTLFDYGEFVDPVLQLKLCDADLPHPPPPIFACKDCHDICFFSSITPGAWNRVITYLTAGMLFGHEVLKPASFVPRRKNTKTRQLNREAPVRRKVFTRLRLGWTDFQIARDLGLRAANVNQHVWRICREEGVPDRYALALKLNFPTPPPLNQPHKAKARRLQVLELLLRDCTLKQMTKMLAIDPGVLANDIKLIYRSHAIVGRTRQNRAALAQKLGRPFTSRVAEICTRVKQLRDSGLTWPKIAQQMQVTEGRMNSYRHSLARLEKQAQIEAKAIEVRLPSSISQS